MEILIVTATEGEVILLKEINSGKHHLEFLVTGPGMVATTFELTRHLAKKKFDLAINCGIAGSFDRSILIGETVIVEEDIFSELGAEDGNDFLTLNKLMLPGEDTFTGTFILENYKLKINRVKGITVNTVHGNEESIKSVTERLRPQIESMEGAAFFFVCEKENLPSLQLRSISNYVEKRNKENWNIPLALVNLKNTLEEIISIL
jgi:futalosine hydrolase